MVESEGREGTVRSITLEELAAIAGALEAALPRDEVLAGAGLSVEAWEAARERWMSRLAAQAARGQLRSSQRYLELVAEQRGRAEAKAREARRKLEGPVPVAPAAHLSPLRSAPRDGAAPTSAAGAGAGGEAAARSPWARMGAGAPPVPGRAEAPALASAVPSPPPPPVPPPVPAVTPAASSEPPPTAPRGGVTLFGMQAVAPREALPFRRDASSAPPADSAATPAEASLNATRIGAVSPLSADKALPFARSAPVAPTDKALPFSRPSPPPPADNALPFARTGPIAPTDKAPLPFSRSAPSPPADNALPFSRSAPSPPADNALPFSRPAPPPPADKALPFARPASSPPADSALPFTRSAPAQPVRDETAPLPPQRSSGSWALPFQQPSSASGTPASASTSPPAARAQAEVDEQEMRRVERITLGEYAHICADLRERPGHEQQIQSRVGLSPQGWAALHAMWHERFQSNPALKARWQALIEQSAQR
ncbi:hypothetical protein [Sorangium cellulosum]|uniref:hypothetical protein n=1 Tax=Sorangium cellulosum TaxID=56 RepID=UPI0005D1CE6D|nr:hypothetical protein [Sorangium cellulosum]